MKREIVIARYLEPTEWHLDIPNDIKISTYNKKHNFNIKHDELYIDDGVIYLANVGRESHTYISHIYHNYDNIADVTFFFQGYPAEVPHWKYLLESNERSQAHWTVFGRTFESVDGWITEHMKNEGYETRQIWDALFEYPPPKTTEITTHAHFRMPKEKILMHSKDTYGKMLDFFVDLNPNNLYGWNFEYFWNLLYNDIHLKHKNK
jgi:hypothetical protein